jgi:thiamine pyrophosphate-dependent acetolactate synthase large subunit-like protein
MSKADKGKVSRRGFLGGAGTAGAAALLGGAGVPVAQAQQPAPNASARLPDAAELARDTGSAQPPASDRAITRPGSDLMVEVLRGLGVEFAVANPASSFEGLHESIINHGTPPNRMPELISALHEGSAVDMAHGYGKATGLPMVVMLHATVGLQNAAMAIYQAFVDKTPMVLLVGSDDGFIQAHVADDLAALVRPYTKWDALPKTLPDCLLAIQQAWHETMTPPCAPTLVVVDSLLQKTDAGSLEIPVYQAPPQISITTDDANRIAQALLAAENPRIDVGRLRTPQGVETAIALAELTGSSVGTRANQGPMSFPQGHPLCGPGAGDAPDFVLGLELPSPAVSIISPDIGTLSGRDANGVGLAIVQSRGVPPPASGGAQRLTADPDSSLSLILEAAIAAITPARRSVIADRSEAHSAANRTARLDNLRRQLERRRRGWDASPVSTARLYGDLWPHIANEDWCIGSQTNFSGGHHADLWQHDKYYSCLGGSGAAGIGYSLGASAGAALAARDRGRIVLDFQNDGDFNFMPGALWTAAHHRLPMLVIMHNNRAWHQELMFVQYLTGVRGRGTDRASIGTTLRDPFVDYKSIANGYGVEAEGPISDPTQLSDAYARGVAAVKEGRPYLIDVLTQPR